MTLEKLLIFGVALSVFGAIATVASNTASDRKPQYTTYKTEVKELIDLIP